MSNSRASKEELESVYNNLRSVARLARDLKAIFLNDKTSYSYSGKESLNRFGLAPIKGKRWLTPAEIASAILKELGYYSFDDVPD